MNSIILCEGRTDAILLSYYLGKVYGWCYSKKPPKAYTRIEADSNQEVNWYKKNDDYLLIYGVGGKDNFQNVIQKYVSQILQNYSEELHRKWLFPYAAKVVNLKWQESMFQDNFGNEQKIRTLSIIIPTDKQGALETTLLDAISEDNYDKMIVDKCDGFIQDIRTIADRYIKTDRLALKAHLSSVFAVISPEKVFSQLDVIIKEVPWEKSETLRNCFEILKEL